MPYYVLVRVRRALIGVPWSLAHQHSRTPWLLEMGRLSHQWETIRALECWYIRIRLYSHSPSLAANFEPPYFYKIFKSQHLCLIKQSSSLRCLLPPNFVSWATWWQESKTNWEAINARYCTTVRSRIDCWQCRQLCNHPTTMIVNANSHSQDQVVVWMVGFSQRSQATLRESWVHPG